MSNSRRRSLVRGALMDLDLLIGDEGEEFHGMTVDDGPPKRDALQVLKDIRTKLERVLEISPTRIDDAEE